VNYRNYPAEPTFFLFIFYARPKETNQRKRRPDAVCLLRVQAMILSPQQGRTLMISRFFVFPLLF